MQLFIKNTINVLLIFCLSAYTIRTGKCQSDEYDAGYLSHLEYDVVKELNLARSHPEVYVEFLWSFLRFFKGNEFREPGEVCILTKEGRSAVMDAISFLEKQTPLPVLSASPGLSRAARDMVRMQEVTNQMGHTGTDGSRFCDRISRYGTWDGACSENIDYGYNTARGIVLALIIDDGVKSRGHRISIFNPRFRRVGVAFGRHRTYNYMCVIDLAQSYTEK